MVAIILMICMLNFIHIVNSECGCNIDRAHTGGTENKYLDAAKQTDEDQCYIGESNVLESNCYKQPGDVMVVIPGGEYQFGTDDILIANDREGPQKNIRLGSFSLDKFEVSNKEFSNFVSATNYKTESETFGDSFVFTLFLNAEVKEELRDFRVAQAPWWYKVSGANWKHPYGPSSNISDLMDHPVIHVSWNDAQAYCKWRGARLPTENEWEAACRGGKQGTKYPWGDKLFPDKKHMANIWQGTFPNYNSAKDGFIGTNPVDWFEQNNFGLYNMAGNVWEWTEDSWSKDKPLEKVKKGGSYLCHKSYCYRYRCSARSHNTDDSSAGNLGFRCAKTL